MVGLSDISKFCCPNITTCFTSLSFTWLLQGHTTLHLTIKTFPDKSLQAAKLKKPMTSEVYSVPLTVACVASVSVWFRGKEIPRKGTFGFDRATFRAVFDSLSSFFSPKPHRNACYAGYVDRSLRFNDWSLGIHLEKHWDCLKFIFWVISSRQLDEHACEIWYLGTNKLQVAYNISF